MKTFIECLAEAATKKEMLIDDVLSGWHTTENEALIEKAADIHAEQSNLHKPDVMEPADVDMWKQEYDGACREMMSLQEQLKEAEREISDLNAELRNAHF